MLVPAWRQRLLGARAWLKELKRAKAEPAADANASTPSA
jgi:hypothetical protein